MSNSALIMMITWCALVTCMMLYCFYRVLNAKKKAEEDSYSDNDEHMGI